MTKNQLFTPTSSMKLYAFQRAKGDNNTSDRSISKTLGISAETICRWKRIDGFKDWLAEQVATYRQPITDRLEQIGLDNLHEFKFWKEMACKFGYLEANPAPERFECDPSLDAKWLAEDV